MLRAATSHLCIIDPPLTWKYHHHASTTNSFMMVLIYQLSLITFFSTTCYSEVEHYILISIQTLVCIKQHIYTSKITMLLSLVVQYMLQMYLDQMCYIFSNLHPSKASVSLTYSERTNLFTSVLPHWSLWTTLLDWEEVFSMVVCWRSANSHQTDMQVHWSSSTCQFFRHKGKMICVTLFHLTLHSFASVTQVSIAVKK